MEDKQGLVSHEAFIIRIDVAGENDVALMVRGRMV